MPQPSSRPRSTLASLAIIAAVCVAGTGALAYTAGWLSPGRLTPTKLVAALAAGLQRPRTLPPHSEQVEPIGTDCQPHEQHHPEEPDRHVVPSCVFRDAERYRDQGEADCALPAGAPGAVGR